MKLENVIAQEVNENMHEILSYPHVYHKQMSSIYLS
jgi:hypothetical protein